MGWFTKDKTNELLVSDYPKSEYKVYWEVVYDEASPGIWTAVVRFMGYSPFTYRSESSTTGESYAEVKSRIETLIKATMQQFRK